MPREPKRERIPKSYSYTPEEKETVVTFDESSETCLVYTCSRALRTELGKKGYPVVTKTAQSTTFSCPKNMITFRTNKKTKRKKKIEGVD